MPRLRFLLISSLCLCLSLLVTIRPQDAVFGGNFLTSPHGDPNSGVYRLANFSLGECAHCHSQHVGKPYNLFTTNDNSLCFTCHEDAAINYPATESDRWPDSIDDERVGYFEAHLGSEKRIGLDYRSRWPGQAVYEDQNTYQESPIKYYSPHGHAPAMPLQDENDKGLCLNCHDPHGTTNYFDMLISPYLNIDGQGDATTPSNYQLCLDCHSSGGPPGMDPPTTRISYYFDSTVNFDGYSGHRIRKSTGSASSWPQHISTGDKLACSNCHNPHGSRGHKDDGYPNTHLISDQRSAWNGLTDTINNPAQGRTFCFGCHVPSDKTAADRGNPSVDGIVMATLRPDSGMHRFTCGPGCNECHGRDYSTSTSYNVHHPHSGSCLECHSRVQGTRRQVTGTGGDFLLASHHVNGAVAVADCLVCHNTCNHKGQTPILNDPDNESISISYSGTPSSLETFCGHCHDIDGASDLAGTKPFSDGTLVPVISLTWTSSSHKTNVGNPLTCFGNGTTTGCHANAHGSNKPTLLAPYDLSTPTEENFCYVCHDGSPVLKDVRVPLAKTYKHPVSRSGYAKPAQSGAEINANRRSECYDCHDPHTAGSVVHTVSGTASGNQLTANSVLKGIWGVEPIVSGGSTYWTQVTQFTELKYPNYPNGITKEYQLCLKCHSYYAFGSTTNGVTNLDGPSGNKLTDQAREFSSSNRSAHPVIQTLANQTRSLAPKNLEATQLTTPWNVNVGNQTMYCSDCHGTDAYNVLDAKGPHGSGKKFMLKDPDPSPGGGNQVWWPLKPTGTLWRLIDMTDSTNRDLIFCARCHPIYSSGWKNNTHEEGDHENAYCVNCHSAVPHGRGISRLIVYYNDPAPYNYNGNSSKVKQFKKATRNNYDRNNCAVSGCSSHPQNTISGGEVVTTGDQTPPSAVANLAVSGTPTYNSVTLTWSAPGDDGSTGTAASYDLRFFTSSISEINWSAAAKAEGEPMPQVAGTNQSFTVTRLSPSTQYYFSLKTYDEVANPSLISNLVIATTSGETGMIGYKAQHSSSSTVASGLTTNWGECNSHPLAPRVTLMNSNFFDCSSDYIELATNGTFFEMYTNSAYNEAKVVSGYSFDAKAKDNTSGGWTVSVQLFYINASGTKTNLGSAATAVVPSSGSINSINLSAISGIVPLSCKLGLRVERTAGSSTQARIYIGADEGGTLIVIEETADSLPPEAVDDLDCGPVTSDSVALTWTAPGDNGSSGTATAYDLRYRTDTAINSANWDTATQLTGEPTPDEGGSNESFIVTGLIYATTYYFALKTVDDADNWSDISNCRTATTLADTSAPAQITDLAIDTVTDTSIQLNWTAPGDDENNGTATAYDLRYRLDANITINNWSTATQVSGEPTPKIAGQSESFTVTGRTPGTTYHFAIRTKDEVEVPNWSGLSNLQSCTTDTTDTTPPAAINDLAVCGSPSQNWVSLTWTAPGDDVDIGLASSYEVRYSTTTINEGNWASATLVTTNVPTPQITGSTEYFTITGLSHGLTYYFAIKTNDEVPNPSALSIIASATTTSGFGGGDCNVDPAGTYFEAENFTGTIVQGATFLVESSQAGYNGTGYLYSNGGSTVTPPNQDGKEYLLNFTTSGNYKVWMRGYANTWNNDSLFIGFDGAWVGALTETPDNIWIWTNTIVTGVGTNQINIPSTGNHTFNIWIRESGHLTDAFYLTQGSETPSGGIPSGKKVIDPTSCGIDTTAPIAISTLSASNPGYYQITLTWTAPGDNGDDPNSGLASMYDLRYATSPIEEGNWASAIQAIGEPAPQAVGSSQSFTVMNLDHNTTYHFAIKTADEMPNWSNISNCPSLATLLDPPEPP